MLWRESDIRTGVRVPVWKVFAGIGIGLVSGFVIAYQVASGRSRPATQTERACVLACFPTIQQEVVHDQN